MVSCHDVRGSVPTLSIHKAQSPPASLIHSAIETPHAAIETHTACTWWPVVVQVQVHNESRVPWTQRTGRKGGSLLVTPTCGLGQTPAQPALQNGKSAA